MKRGTVDQVDESQEAKVRMVTLCNVVKLVLAVWLIKSPDLNVTPEEVKSCASVSLWQESPVAE